MRGVMHSSSSSIPVIVASLCDMQATVSRGARHLQVCNGTAVAAGCQVDITKHELMHGSVQIVRTKHSSHV